MILLKRQYTIGGQELTLTPPVDPNLLPGYTYRDVLPQGTQGSPPINAVNHLFDFSFVSSQAYFLPNLAMPSAGLSSLLFHTEGVEVSCFLRTSNTTGNDNRDLGYYRGNDYPKGIFYHYEVTGQYYFPGEIGDNDLFGWERENGVLRIVKYSAGVRSLVFQYGNNSGEGSTLYPSFSVYPGTKIKKLQYQGVTIV